MASEKPSVADLLKVLRECGKGSEQIIDILSAIIQSKQMYGGDIQNQIDYYIWKALEQSKKYK
jgi:hypothetical protein